MQSTSIVPASAVFFIHKEIRLCGVEKLKAMTKDELVGLVKEANGKATKAAKQTLLHVGQTGVALIYLKEVIPHGRFMREVEFLTGISQRTANNYMAIARHYGNVSNLKGVRDALGYIREASDRAKEMDGILGIPCKVPTPAPTPAIEAEIVTPSPLHRAPASAVTVEAEIVEPVTAPAGESEVPEDHDEVDEPEVVIVDGIKEAHQPEVVERPTVASGPEMRPDEMERKAMVEAGKTVYANLKRDHNLIAWAESKGLAVRVDRKSIFGNPFVMPGDGNRDEVCDLFGTTYLPNKKSILAALPSLRGKVLLCWCYPERCHAQSLIEALTGGPSK